jgi:hypothetical protein
MFAAIRPPEIPMVGPEIAVLCRPAAFHFMRLEKLSGTPDVRKVHPVMTIIDGKVVYNTLGG